MILLVAQIVFFTLKLKKREKLRLLINFFRNNFYELTNIRIHFVSF